MITLPSLTNDWLPPDTQLGLQARLMSKALRKITGSLARSKCTVIFLNQLRSKIGVLYGNPEVTSGGNALKFFATLRLEVRRKEMLKDERGIKCKVKVVKNKVAPPFRMVELDLVFGEGIDKEGSLIDAAERLGVVERKGAWYRHQGSNIAQGRVKLKQVLKADEALRTMVEEQVREKLQPVEWVDVEAQAEEEGEEKPIMSALPAASPLMEPTFPEMQFREMP